MSSFLLHFHLPIPIQFLLSFLITIDQKQSSKISCDRLLEIPFWIVCCTHSLSFACSSCLNRMASIKMVEASIVCAANMDVTVLCRRLQIFIYILVPSSSWSKIHDWSNLFPVIMIFFSHLVCSGISLPQEILPRFDQFDNCISAWSDCTILTAMSVFGSGFLNSSHVLLFPFSGENCVVKKRCWRLMLVTIIAVGDIMILVSLALRDIHVLGARFTPIYF